MFDEKVKQSLNKIIKEYGINIYKEPSRLEGLLKDYCGTYKKEIFMIVSAAKDNIPRDIYESNISIEMLKTRMVAKVIDDLGFGDEVAEGLVWLWFLVLGKITEADYDNRCNKPNEQKYSSEKKEALSYKDSQKPEAVKPEAIKPNIIIKIGDYIKMGKYYDEPILWRCVDIDINGPLMLSDKILTFNAFDASGIHKYLDGTYQVDNNGYRTMYGSNLWETSNIRCWLNSTETSGNVKYLDGCPPTKDNVRNGYNAYANEKGFLAEGNFTADERVAIKSVTQKSLLNDVDVKLEEGGVNIHIYSSNIAEVVQNYNNSYYHMVTDKMFLLDVKQLNHVYLNSHVLGKDYWIGKPTEKAVNNSNYKDSGVSIRDNCKNWTRSPYTYSGDPHGVRYVSPHGYVDYSLYADSGILGVRPAFYINLSSEIFKSGNGNVRTLMW